MPKPLSCGWLLYMFRCLKAMIYKLGACVWKTTKVPLNIYMYVCKSDVYVHSLIGIIHNKAPRVSTRDDSNRCHVLKSLWMTLALVCRWKAAYGRDFPNCGGLHAYPLKFKICSMALKISEHRFASFFWVTPWNQLTVSFHWQQCTLKGQIYTKDYR